MTQSQSNGGMPETRKPYAAPAVSLLGHVRQLTTGGSGRLFESDTDTGPDKKPR